MPITSAARLASRASSSVQQPRAPVRYERGFLDRARWTPVTSWPASAARAAATAESTPPDMAASTRSLVIGFEGMRPAAGPGKTVTMKQPAEPPHGTRTPRDHDLSAPIDGRYFEAYKPGALSE